MIVERKREFGTLIALGAHKGLVARIVVSEAVAVTRSARAWASSSRGSHHLLLRARETNNRPGVPDPSLPVIAGLAAGAVAAMGLVALVSSWIALRALNTADASALLKEGE